MIGLLLALNIMAFPSSGEAQCFVKYDVSKSFYKINKCDAAGVLVSTEQYFSVENKISNIHYFDKNGAVIKKIVYSTAGDSSVSSYKYTEHTKITTLFERNNPLIIKSKKEENLSDNKVIRKWTYLNGQPQWVDEISDSNEKQVVQRAFLTKENDFLTYKFNYRPMSKFNDEVETFEIFDRNNKKIGEYSYNFDGKIEDILRKQFSGNQLNKMISIFNDQNRLPVAVIDSGFDIRHPTITPFLINSKVERWGNVDNDSNGLIGDAFGWSFDAAGLQSPNINEPIISGGFHPFPISHGTHVASIAMRGHDKAALIGFSGDVSNPDYLNLVSNELKLKNIRLANMSWGFKEAGAPFTPKPASYVALKEFIVSNPQTLMVVAAGNNAWDLDGDKKDYPASYKYSNLLVVGSLNVPDYSFKNDKELRPAIYRDNLGSNIGEISVDVFSPGKDVDGAKIGGGMIRKSGTSMASPFALNSIIYGLLENKRLSTLELKSLVMKSVGYIKKPLPCVSKGFVNPERLRLAAQLLSEDSEMSIEDAVIEARKDMSLYYPGEIELSKEKRQSIWKNVDNSIQESK